MYTPGTSCGISSTTSRGSPRTATETRDGRDRVSCALPEQALRAHQQHGEQHHEHGQLRRAGHVEVELGDDLDGRLADNAQREAADARRPSST